MEIKEILQELLKFYEKHPTKNIAGLCMLTHMRIGKLDARAYLRLKDYLTEKKKKGQVFYTHRGHRTNDPSKFWWKYGENEPRVKWLKEQIKELG